MENKIMAGLKFGCLFNFFGAMKWTSKISDHAKKKIKLIWRQLAMYMHTVSLSAHRDYFAKQNSKKIIKTDINDF